MRIQFSLIVANKYHSCFIPAVTYKNLNNDGTGKLNHRLVLKAIFTKTMIWRWFTWPILTSETKKSTFQKLYFYNQIVIAIHR